MKKKSILISAIAMLAVSAIVLSTASYAWFVGSVTPSITNVKVGVTERNLLSLSGTSLDGTGSDWRTVLDTSQATTQFVGGRYINKWMATATPNNATHGLDAVSPFRVESDFTTADRYVSGLPGSRTWLEEVIVPYDVGPPEVQEVKEWRQTGAVVTSTDIDTGTPGTTSAAAMDWDFMRKNVGDTEATSSFIADETDSTRNVVMMRFMMRADRPCSVLLKTDKTAGGTVTNFDSSTTAYPTNDVNQVLIDYSLRMAFVYSAEFEPTAATPTTYANAKYENYKIWAPYDETTAALDTNDVSIRDPNSSGRAEGSGYTYVSGYAANVPLFTFTKSLGVREVICYIWIEGADPDCVDSVAGGLFNTTIAFTGSTTP